MFALADCNNFFASCERVFRPDLQGKPIIVLSSNDGCAVARSNEAKALGIKMGAPFFKIRDIVEKHNVAVFSGNMVRLMPANELNTAYKPIEVTPDNEFLIWGVVTYVIKKM